MLARTHLAFSFLIAILLKPMINVGNEYIFFAVFLIGSVLPDVDSEHSLINSQIPILPKIWTLFIKHRGIFHSLFMAVFLGGAVWYFINKTYGFALFAGYLSHILIDGFTRSGVNLLHPISQFKLEGPVETGKIAEHVILVILILLIFARLV